jgi:hypothetical protein
VLGLLLRQDTWPTSLAADTLWLDVAVDNICTEAEQQYIVP